VAQVEVGGGGIYAEVDAEWRAGFRDFSRLARSSGSGIISAAPFLGRRVVRRRI